MVILVSNLKILVKKTRFAKSIENQTVNQLNDVYMMRLLALHSLIFLPKKNLNSFISSCNIRETLCQTFLCQFPMTMRIIFKQRSI